MRLRGRAAARLLVFVALALQPACAPRPTALVPVTGGTRGARYLSRLAERERRAVMVEASGTLWARLAGACDTCPRRRLPAVQASLVLAWPDAFRLRADSWFGTAVDLGIDGDSVTVYSPLEKAGVALDAVGDSLGPRDPGRLAVRLACAAWQPPDSAWGAGTPEGDLLVLRWREDGDSIAVGVDGAGRPAWAWLSRDGSRGVRVDYERWQLTDGVDWPIVLRVGAEDGGPGLTARFERVRFTAPADRLRLRVRIPAGVDRLEPARLARILGGVEGFR